jgi:hypothetical protein
MPPAVLHARKAITGIVFGAFPVDCHKKNGAPKRRRIHG